MIVKAEPGYLCVSSDEKKKGNKADLYPDNEIR